VTLGACCVEVVSRVSRRDYCDVEDDNDGRTKLAIRGSQGIYEIKVFGDYFLSWIRNMVWVCRCSKTRILMAKNDINKEPDTYGPKMT
jgi:hypothetical protein